MSELEKNVEKSVENGDNPAEGAQNEGTVDYEPLYHQMAKSLSDVTAERDSLLSENTELRQARDAAIADGQKTKEINYTLSRQLNIHQQAQKQPEEIMAEMFLKKGD